MNGIYLYFVTNTFRVGRYWDFKLGIVWHVFKMNRGKESRRPSCAVRSLSELKVQGFSKTKFISAFMNISVQNLSSGALVYIEKSLSASRRLIK